MKKVALIENTGKDFFISRIRFAKFLMSKGCEVTAIVPDDGYKEKIEESGIYVILTKQNIRGKGFTQYIQFTYDLYSILRNNHFDVIHCYRMQPNIIGGFIGGILRQHIINHVTGLGSVFVQKTPKKIMSQFIIRFCYMLNSRLFKTKYIFQNEHDSKDLNIKTNYTIIRGSAVNEELFYPSKTSVKKDLQSSSYNLLFVSRLLKSKGLSNLVNALIHLRENEQIKVNLVIAGWIDDQNPESYSNNQLNDLINHSFINFLGQREDIPELIRNSDICVLPTYYREGTPRFLLEAMACGKPIITCKMPGCSHLVEDNGVLVQPNNDLDLANGIKIVINKDLNKLGAASSSLYKNKFSEEIIYNQIFRYYQL